ncbi:MAG: hypothetical protein ABI281_00500 [Caldimonas sp.]
MKILSSLAVVATAAALAGCGSMYPSSSAKADAEPDNAVVLLPNVGAGAAVQNGCWATFFDERNFNGDSLTLVGPAELKTLDKGSARQLKRDIKSVVTGPRATLLLYQRQFLSARSVGFQPNSREPGLAEKLGFGGRIESMQLKCAS